MADTSQGDGWWMASDQKWYPPDLHADPEHRAAHDAPVAEPEPAPVPEPDTVPEPEPALLRAARPPVSFEAPSQPPTSPPLAQPEAPPVTIAGLDGAPKRRAILILALGMVGFLAGVGLVFGLISSNDNSDPATGPQGQEASADGPSEPLPPLEPNRSTLPESSVGSREQPAALGEIYDWGDWRAGVVEVLDAESEGLIADFGDPSAGGNTFLAVIYEISYTGEALTQYEPVVVSVEGARRYEPFACFLDPTALAQRGVRGLEFELVTGQTTRLAECFEVPTDDVDNLVFVLENYQEFDAAVVFQEGGDDLADPGPLDATPNYDVLDLLNPGTTTRWAEWSGTVTDVFLAADAGLVSRFADPQRDGYSYVVIAYELTYSGLENPAPLQAYASALGSAVFSSRGCVLEPDGLEALGLGIAYEVAPNSPVSLAQCVEVPDDELGSFVVRLESFADFEDEAAYYTAPALS